MRVRLFRVSAIPGLHWRVERTVPPPRLLVNWLSVRAKIFPSTNIHENFALNVLVDGRQANTVTVEHPSDISQDDIHIVSEDMTHDYRIRFMGYSSISAACVWSFIVMPNGGWFAILFKDLALPLFGSYSALRAADMFSVMKGSEIFLQSIKQGKCDFIPEKK